jgi:hypothetical protein
MTLLHPDEMAYCETGKRVKDAVAGIIRARRSGLRKSRKGSWRSWRSRLLLASWARRESWRSTGTLSPCIGSTKHGEMIRNDKKKDKEESTEKL